MIKTGGPKGISPGPKTVINLPRDTTVPGESRNRQRAVRHQCGNPAQLRQDSFVRIFGQAPKREYETFRFVHHGVGPIGEPHLSVGFCVRQRRPQQERGKKSTNSRSRSLSDASRTAATRHKPELQRKTSDQLVAPVVELVTVFAGHTVEHRSIQRQGSAARQCACPRYAARTAGSFFNADAGPDAVTRPFSST